MHQILSHTKQNRHQWSLFTLLLIYSNNEALITGKQKMLHLIYCLHCTPPVSKSWGYHYPRGPSLYKNLMRKCSYWVYWRQQNKIQRGFKKKTCVNTGRKPVGQCGHLVSHQVYPAAMNQMQRVSHGSSTHCYYLPKLETLAMLWQVQEKKCSS
jgi:hypothetical protein